MQQPPTLGDRILGALLIGDVAHRAFIAHDLAGFVAHGGSAVREPEHRVIARAHLILEFAHHSVALHQQLVFCARRRMDIDGVCDVADAVDHLLRRIVSHDPCQRRIGVEKRAGRRCHINAIDRALEQLAIALLGKPLLGQGMNRRFARGVGVHQRAAEHFGGAGNVTDLVFDIGGGNRGILLASGERTDGSRDGLERPDSTAHHEQRRGKPDQHPGNTEENALPLVVGKGFAKIVGQHTTAAGAYVPQ